MNDQELRALVRDAVARHAGGGASPAGLGPGPAPEHGSSSSEVRASIAPHASHSVYIRVVNATGACLIEPTVECTHCRYCQSHGY